MVNLQKQLQEQAKARTAKKHIAQTSEGKAKNFQNGLAKIEGIITSAIQTKYLLNDTSYYWAFFQLEGIDSEIPVIFRLKPKKEKGYSKFDQEVNEWLDNKGFPRDVYPKIPPKAKILLKGSWAESENSPRPSFTCLEYQILAPPPKLTIKDLREKISQLLTISLEKQSEWKQRTDYLFKKQKDFQEIDKITQLGEEYLQAYLLIRRAYYSNYQSNLLPHNQFNMEEYLTKISQEIEEIDFQIRAYQSKEKPFFKENSHEPK